MPKFRKIAFVLAVASINIASLGAQDYREKIQQNPDRAASVYHYYEYTPTLETKAPKGFKPFYISHYGRHGSRYHGNSTYMDRALLPLRRGDTLGILTGTGKALLKDMEALLEEHQGMFGMLTSRGAGEHRAIAKRMFQRAPEVFNGKNGRHEVYSVSSYFPRCLVSMTNFHTSLLEYAHNLDITYKTGPKYLDYLCMTYDLTESTDAAADLDAKLRPTLEDTERLPGLIFSDKQKGLQAMDGNPSRFLRYLYEGGAVSGNVEQDIDIYKYFTTEELINQWILRNDRLYCQFGNDINTSKNTSAIARPLLKDFIEKADEAIKDGSTKAADLRFGHDTGILPLVCFIGIRPMDVKYNAEVAHNYWNSFEMIPMAANLQMIFYKNKKGEVIVKLLYNEKETTIPAVPSFDGDGPYHRWQDLRSYFITLLEGDGDKTVNRDLSQSEKSVVD